MLNGPDTTNGAPPVFTVVLGPAVAMVNSQLPPWKLITFAVRLPRSIGPVTRPPTMLVSVATPLATPELTTVALPVAEARRAEPPELLLTPVLFTVALPPAAIATMPPERVTKPLAVIMSLLVLTPELVTVALPPAVATAPMPEALPLFVAVASPPASVIVTRL